MKKITITTNSLPIMHLTELPDDIQISWKAIAVRKMLRPYSKISVGVAILLDNGQIVLGSNQENAAYPLALR
jgi:cytidine deaminase